MIKELLEYFIGNLFNKPKAVQCLWYSEFNYIGLSIELVIENKFGYSTQKITELRYRDFDSTNDIVIEAKRIASNYTKKYNIELYFPSPDEFLRDCPNWWDLKSAKRCEDCNTPIIPSDSEFLPKEICYPCHLEREMIQRIKDTTRISEIIAIYLCKSDEYEPVSHSNKIMRPTIAPYIKHLLDNSNSDLLIKEITLCNKEIAMMSSKIEADIEAMIIEYTSYDSEIDYKDSKGNKIIFKDSEYCFYNPTRMMIRKLSRLIEEYELVQKALNENYTYTILFNNSMLEREVSILRFIHFINKDYTSINELTKHYDNILTKQEISESILKLKNGDCLVEESAKFKLSEKAIKLLDFNHTVAN